jgi:hypothetical protein
VSITRLDHWVGNSHWLGKGQWDLIFFNFGLDDLRYIDDRGRPAADPSQGRPVTSVQAYEDNLRILVQSLKFTRAKLIFATTTRVPPGAEARIPGDEGQYNDVALRVMKETNVPVYDLASVALAHPELQLPRNVQFSAEGRQLLGQAVAENIRIALGK